MCGEKLYWPLTGTLSADRDNATFDLTNIMGTLTAGAVGSKMGSMEITGGSLTNSGGNASGSFTYILEGNLDEKVTFYFVGEQMCCNDAPNGGPNNLSATGFTLWGNNWNVNIGETKNDVDVTPLGIDLVGGQYTPTPEPSTMLLFGSGLAGLAAWRYRKSAKS